MLPTKMSAVLSATKLSCQFIFTSIFKKLNKLAFQMSWATTLETYRSEKNWQTEKEKYLNMNADQKCRNFVDWQKIPTWKEYATTKTLESKIEAQQGYIIDNSQNKALADKVSYFAGNIIQLNVDVIVNAANKSLLGGGGVDGAIHKAAGMNLLNECRILMGCSPGLAEITGGYKLPAKYIIHTVGPQDKKAYVLQSCYKTSLKLMLENNLRTIAFPCISTGAYGYPNESAAHIAIYTVRQHLQEHADKIDRIIFCLFTDIDKKIYEGLLQTYFPLD